MQRIIQQNLVITYFKLVHLNDDGHETGNRGVITCNVEQKRTKRDHPHD